MCLEVVGDRRDIIDSMRGSHPVVEVEGSPAVMEVNQVRVGMERNASERIVDSDMSR